MSKKILIGFPHGMIEQLDYVASHEHRTRSDLVREACRQYLARFKQVNGISGAIPSLESADAEQSMAD